MACGMLGGPGLGPIMLCTEPGEGPGPGLGPRMGPGDRPAPGEGPAWDIPTGGSLGVDIYQLRIWGENEEKLEPTVNEGFSLLSKIPNIVWHPKYSILHLLLPKKEAK